MPEMCQDRRYRKRRKDSPPSYVFEMLGNFSFGDYFKHEAIAWSWEFLTKVLELDPERLYPSIYGEDEEALTYGQRKLVFRLKRSHVFTEIRKPENVITSGSMEQDLADHVQKSIMIVVKNTAVAYPDCKVGCECDRFMEVWNNVFTQFNGDGHGGYEELENKNIDTGMGLERLAVVMQDVDSVLI